ncbi:hypothetical protein DSL64_19880 [Dyadobacter luteus]|jgi:type III secretory pathway lipoprotein EscJ|uniref:Uncharacterized protein n=1 Tax=Dyadobacter luteus TaxID=2259619 RepID=A0A3D8Y6W1_9BACT|nr:hypothetical protein [Dyadobacter luteus]REA58628.1 hypothetical protein DSL64_19880 [Dyadobacter luteus]
MKISKVIAFVASVALLTSCEYQKYNHIGQKDVNETSTYVYGVSRDSLPAQMKQQYTAKPELETRVNAIREKLYSGATSAVAKQ